MSLSTLLDQFSTEELSDEARDKFVSRKEALGKLGNYSKKMALAALPLGAVAAFGTPAKAQSTEDLVGVLNFALTLEYLEAEFYAQGVDSGIIDTYGKAKLAHGEIFREIADHEADHVVYLQAVIGDVLGGEPLAREDVAFDFTGGSGSGDGPFSPFEDNAQFLTLAQAFEDTGVRAYKGQAGAVAGNDVVLTRALQIHSVEARHAARVRQLRGLNGWITGGPDGEQVPDAARAVYAGEGNTNQVVEVSSTLSGDGDVDTGDITEAWDEPLLMDDVLAIASPFIADNS